MAVYLEKTDQAEERASTAKQTMKESIQKLEALEEQRRSFNSRISMLGTDLAKTYEKLQENEAKLSEIERKADDDNTFAKDKADEEQERDVNIANLECVLADAIRERDETICHLKDCERKEKVVQNELQRTTEKGENLEARVNELEHDLEFISSKMSMLEDQENDSYQRAELTEEKVKFLEDQIKLATEREEEAIGKIRHVERDIDRAKDDKAAVQAKHRDIVDQLEEINQLGDICSDEED